MHQLIVKVKADGTVKYNAELVHKFKEKFRNKIVLVTLETFDDGKTASQRGYYFAAVVRDASQHFGWTEHEMHDWLKEECNKRELVNKRTGEVFYVAGSTVPLRKMEYAAFIDRAIRRLAEEGYVVKTPEEYFKSIRYKED